ncbi:MAG: hypothetical protein E5Y02_25460 [Mesorhizobium sp.]|nr:MAG: hypothetical protein E5Y02_25460 [Mesorhizobium sp.]
MGFWRRLFGGDDKVALGHPDLSDLIVAIDGDDGTPASKYQREALERLGCGAPAPKTTYAQASAIMSARAFSRVLLDDLLTAPGVKHPRRPQYLAMQAKVIAFVVRDVAARTAICAWNQRNFDEAKEDAPPRNIHWMQASALLSPIIENLREG